MKKNILLIAILFFGAMLFSAFTVNDSDISSNPTLSVKVSDSQSGIVFRTTQKLKSRDGGEIYFYSSGKCEMYQNDRLVVSCTYTIDDNEVKLLDEKGNTVYKGRISWNNTKSYALSVTIAGTTYYKK